MAQRALRETLRVMGIGLVIFGLAACGGGGGSTGDSTPASGASAGLSGSPIEIAMVTALTGEVDGEANGSAGEVATAWEQWVNEDEGGINGHPVHVIVKDSKNDTATGLREAKELIADPQVLAEVGGHDSIGESAIVKAFDEAKVPIIGGAKTTPEVIEDNPYLFSLVPPTTVGVPLFADGAKPTGVKSVGMALCSQSASCAGAAELIKPRLEELGMNFAGYVGVSAGEPTYTAACLALQEKGAEEVQLAIPLPTAIQMIEDCEAQGTGFQSYAANSGTFDGSKLRPLSESTIPIVGNIFAFPWWAEAPAIKRFRAVIEERAPDANYENSLLTAEWTGLEMFRKAMAHVGSHPSRQQVAEAMWTVRNESLEGLLPQPVSFEKGKAGSPVDCQWRTTLSDGKFSDTKVVCLDDKGT